MYYDDVFQCNILLLVNMCDREVHSKRAFRRFEGAGGSLTVYDTEESPLSKMQAVRLTPEIWEGRLCNRNELHQMCTVNPKGRDCLIVDGTSNPAGASPSSPVWHQQGQVGR